MLETEYPLVKRFKSEALFDGSLSNVGATHVKAFSASYGNS